MRAVSVLVPVALIVGVATVAAAADIRRPTGQVLLTVAGDVANTNRAAADEQGGAFFTYHELTFDRAFAFDRTMLEGLGMAEVRVAYRDWRQPITVAGPRLSDVLQAAGCGSVPLRTLALDGFSTVISTAEVKSRDWVLTTRAGGRPHGIGGRGPLWLVFDPPGERPAAVEEESMWSWALFLIECG